tara:strand:- start:352 stop:1404 length:1053 start_codon:yes stop_codon:yes gene_type:complete
MQEEYTPQVEQPVEEMEPQIQPEVEPITDDSFFQVMKNELNRDAKFSEEEMAALREKFENEKVEYANGDKETQAKLEAGVVQTGERMFNAEEFRKSLASNLDADSGIGHSPTEKLANYTNDMVNIVNGNNEVSYKDNMPGYELSDGWKSFNEIDDLVKSRYVDETSKSSIQTLIEDSSRQANDVQKGEDATFNYQKEYNNMLEKVIETGDMKSLATDKIFGNRVFKDDLMKSIKMGKYTDMGLTEAQVMELDPTKDGKISHEDAAIITSSILRDDDMLKNYLADYYTKAMEQNYYNNLSPEVRKATQTKQNLDNESKAPTTGLMSRPQLSIQDEVKVKGGVIRNGKFMAT